MSIGTVLRHSTLSDNRIVNTSLAQLCALIYQEMLLMLQL
uniref:Ycf15 n=1 Tax=Parascaris univalens TaxID=6257 RepID=A0A915BI25_PARUN